MYCPSYSFTCKMILMPSIMILMIGKIEGEVLKFVDVPKKVSFVIKFTIIAVLQLHKRKG